MLSNLLGNYSILSNINYNDFAGLCIFKSSIYKSATQLEILEAANLKSENSTELSILSSFVNRLVNTNSIKGFNSFVILLIVINKYEVIDSNNLLHDFNVSGYNLWYF